jgi:uncharacterized protein (TIGR03000 family)
MAAVAALTTLVAWFGVRPSEAKDWPGPYDQAARRYYADEERDYRALGYDATGTGRVGNGRSYYPYYYSAYSQSVPVRDNAARIRLIVPTEAKVWFDSKPTTQAGPERNFESPVLTPGRQYSYEVKALWRDKDGKEVTRTRQVDVSANANVTVDFTR